MKTLNDFNFSGKRVLVRCDFQVPLDEEGEILDDFKIKSTIPTIEYLIENGAKTILMSHWKPEGQEQAYSLAPISLKLERLLNQKVNFLNDCIGEKIKEEVDKMEVGQVVLLENLRFHKEEEENNENFARELSKLGDIYINDAFSVSHRNHASVVGITKFLPSGAGLLLEKEINVLSSFMKKPQRPLLAIIGGKKVETKTKLINAVSEISDWVLISGLMQKELKEKNIKLKYPEKIIGPVDEVNKGEDIGPKTIEIFKEKISQVKTIFWNGPFGMIEEEEFQKGTREIANAIIKSGAFSVVGGGETVEFINKLGLIGKFNHVSTGGGAMLAFLGGEKLPGIDALNQQ